MESVRLRRLKSDHEVLRRLANRHPKIEIEGVSGNPPDRYRIKMRVRSLREKGSIYRISEITVTASIPPQIGFAIARGDDADIAVPAGGVTSSELADRLATDDEVVDLEGDVLETISEAPSED